MITLKELAEKSNVSIATISNTLNGKANVSEETRNRILKIVKETGYKPNYMARGLRASSTKTIGLIVDDITAFSTPQIINGIMSLLEEKGYRTIFENLRFYSRWGIKTKDNEEYKAAINSAIEEFTTIKTDGIIYIADHARNICEIPEELSLPLVICYAFTDRPNTPFIMIDDENAAFSITEYLIDNNCSKIGVITGSEDNIHTEKRTLGYKKALEKHGINLEESLVKTGDWERESGYQKAKELVKENKGLSAIFCYNDIMAAGAYQYLNEKGIIIGKDISLVGFDNRDVSDFLNPPLTTMEIPLFPIGEAAAQAILDLIKSKKSEDKIYIPCKLIDRQSVIKDK